MAVLARFRPISSSQTANSGPFDHPTTHYDRFFLTIWPHHPIIMSYCARTCRSDAQTTIHMTKLTTYRSNADRGLISLSDLFFDTPAFNYVNWLSSDWTLPSSYSASSHETDDSTSYRFDLPGFKKADVTVEIENRVLTVRAKSGDNSRTYRATLGRGLQVDAPDAKLEDGVLTVTIPKSPAVKPLRIDVK